MSFHLYNINEIYSNADGSVQYIEMAVGNSSGESFWQGHTITVTQGGTTHAFTFPSNLPSTATNNTSVLIATQGFADLGLVTPDFIVPAGFLFSNGGTVNYAGVDSMSYTSLPGGTLSLSRNGSTGTNTPTDFAGHTASIPANPVVGDGGANALDGTSAIDLMLGGAGNDTLNGGAGADTMLGGAGDDTLTGASGNDVSDGGLGTDTIMFTGDRSAYNLSKVANGYQVADKISGRDGTDTVKNSEVLQFADMKVDLTMGSKAASISAPDLKTLEELYVGFFNRIPEAAGLAGWINQIKNGMTLKAVADQFYNFGVLFGVYQNNMSETDFITKIYANVLGRVGATAPSNDEIAGWQNWLHTGANTKGAMVVEMLNISHGLFTGDPDYGWVVDLLDNKAEVANYFAVQQGLSYNTPQENIDHGTAIAAAITPDSTAAAITLIGVNEFSV